MGRMKSTNVWIYFTAVDEEKKVKCKLCYKYLMGKRSYNLKKHLKSAHKIEVRSTDRRRSPNKKFKHSDDLNDDAGSDFEQNPNDTNEFENSAMQQYTILEEGQENNDDNFYDITTQQMDQTNDSEGHDSCSILPTNSSVIDIKEEVVQENTDLRNNTSVNEPSIEVDNESLRNNANTSKPTENCTTNNNTHTVSTPPPLIKYIKAPIRVLESLSKSTKPAKQINHIKPPLRKRKLTTLDNDPLEENINTECNSSDNSNKDPSAEFKEWSVKKKELLEIELLEMRNYKYKLELWQKEKELQVECSKYTKDIRGNK